MVRALRFISGLNGHVNLLAGRRAGSGVLPSATPPVGVGLKRLAI